MMSGGVDQSSADSSTGGIGANVCKLGSENLLFTHTHTLVHTDCDNDSAPDTFHNTHLHEPLYHDPIPGTPNMRWDAWEASRPEAILRKMLGFFSLFFLENMLLMLSPLCFSSNSYFNIR